MPENPKPTKQPKTAKLRLEQLLWSQGCTRVVGVDEAGRGAWAGPVYAAAVCLPPDNAELTTILAGVRDSKQMTKLARARAIDIIQRAAWAWGVASADHAEIEALGIVPATCLAMERALEICCRALPECQLDYLLLDSTRCEGLNLHYSPLRAMIRGDQKSLSIAAASVLAKASRDAYMQSLDTDSNYAHYQFGIHKGYGTTQHRDLLHTYGVSPLHRKTYKPIRALIAEAGV